MQDVHLDDHDGSQALHSDTFFLCIDAKCYESPKYQE